MDITIPSCLDIFGTTYTVELKALDCQGETFLDKSVIYISPDYSGRIQRVTLIHEIMHSILDQKGMYLMDSVSQVADKELKEHLLINAFDWTLFEVLEANPALRRWLWS